MHPNRTPNCVCAQCGKPFYASPSDRAKYCGRACYFASPERRKLRVPRIQRSCQHCGRAFDWRPGDGAGMYCSRSCWYQHQRKATIDGDGYIRVWDGDRHILEHRLVMEHHIGRPLRTDEHVHHINEVRTDNRPENLRILSHAEHISLHKTKPREQRTCQHCGVQFDWLPGRGKGIYCSQDCHYRHRAVIGWPEKRRRSA